MSENAVVSLTAGNLNPSAKEYLPTYPAHYELPFFSPPQPSFFPDFLYPVSPQAYLNSLMSSPVYLPPLTPPPAFSPTRAILLTAVPPDVSEPIVRRELEIFGDIRAIQMERISEGILTVHFYDLRVAHAVLNAVCDQHMQHQYRLRMYYNSFLRPNISGPPPPPPPPSAPGLISGQPVWAQFSIPDDGAFPDCQNQGSLVVFNVDAAVSDLALKEIFQTFGEVKEIRETPMKKNQRFVEFYDVRDASRALSEMNGKEISGQSVVIDYSRPGGHYMIKKFNHHFNFKNNHQYNDKNKKFLESLPTQQPPSLNLSRRRSSSPNNQRRRSFPRSEDWVDNETATSPKQRQVLRKSKSWKGKEKDNDPRFLIKDDAIIEESGLCKDTRTTLMIKNIPNKYSQKLLLNMLDNHCMHCNKEDDNLPVSSYDFVYLPMDFSNKCNMGYGFVNMTSPEATLRFYKSFHRQRWEALNSTKICEITYARLQGVEALKEHFKKSKFACENDEYLPVVFTPPRDGRQSPAPHPIVVSNTATTSSSKVHDLDCIDIEMDGSDIASSTTCISDINGGEDHNTIILENNDHYDDHDHDHDHDNDGGDSARKIVGCSDCSMGC